MKTILIAIAVAQLLLLAFSVFMPAIIGDVSNYSLLIASALLGISGILIVFSGYLSERIKRYLDDCLVD